ncbi:MAG: DNA sulfur modification protein DndB [Polaromonas sp.]|nr:DNA sulfur modification protein DndB [Hylemonella sp.]MDP1955900.1 DNA sulfur modification protein DndB [Polaromonas sp.]
MSPKILLPAIRSRVGDWTFYSTTMRLADVASHIKAPDEVHESKKLSDWIQREVIDSHAKMISEYITTNEQRFLGSIIVGVYGGHPDWSPLKIRLSNSGDLTDSQIRRLESALGVLHLSGEEKLFAVDGQHRVEGIKRAIKSAGSDSSINDDSISAVFISHDPDTAEGVARTRRLFTTLNKKAKAVSKSQTIALDEDNGFAIITRRLIDSHWLFSGEDSRVAFNSTGSLGSSEKDALTSIVGLFEIVKDLYNGPGDFDQKRPSEEVLDKHLQLCKEFFDSLVNHIPEYHKVFMDKTAQPADFRTSTSNHLLFRPIGQRSFARATQLLISRGASIEDAVTKLAKADLNLLSEHWAHILWNPVTEQMMTGALIVGEANLLELANEKTRNQQSLKRLGKLRESINAAAQAPGAKSTDKT